MKPVVFFLFGEFLPEPVFHKIKFATDYWFNIVFVCFCNELMEKLAFFMPRLMSLKVVDSRISDQGINILAQNLFPGHLRCLDIASPNGNSGSKIHDESLCRLIQNQPNLRHFCIRAQIHLTKQVVKTLAEVTENTGSLHYLDISILQYNKISDSQVSSVVANNPNLRFLDVTLLDVSDSTIVEVSNHCLDFREVVLHGMRGKVTNVGVTALAAKCKNLTKIDMDDSMDSINDDSVIALAKNSKNLQEAILKSCTFTEKAIQTLIEGCPQLRKISSCRDLSDEIKNKGLLLEKDGSK